MPKHWCSVEININPSILVYLVSELQLDLRVLKVFHHFLLEKVHEKCNSGIVSSHVKVGKFMVATPHPLDFIKMGFTTGCIPPMEWAKLVTGKSQVFAGCLVRILHINSYVNEETLTISVNGKATKEEIDPYFWSLKIRGIDWEPEWIIPSLEARKDPLDPQRKNECEIFCRKHDLMDFWTIDSWANMLYGLLYSLGPDYKAQGLDPTGKLLEPYSTLDGFGWGW